MTTTRRLSTYASFVKLEHTIFSLPLVYAGAFIGARGRPPLGKAVLVLVAAAGARIAAMGINRLVDVDVDRRNPRTARRELATGVMQPGEGKGVVTVGILLYALAAGLLSPLCLALAPIPLALFGAYPYLKRFTSLCHLGLGLAWSMAPLGGWLAMTGSTAGLREVSWLWLFSLLWVAGFDIIYAMMDEKFDRAHGVHSIPASAGRSFALRMSMVMHAVAYLALIELWRSHFHNSWSMVWLLAIGGCLIWEHAIAPRHPEIAFFEPNAVIGFLVLGFVIAGTI